MAALHLLPKARLTKSFISQRTLHFADGPDEVHRDQLTWLEQKRLFKYRSSVQRWLG